MAAHEKRDERAQRRARAALATIGQELRSARLNHDLSQTVAGRGIGVSASTWSRLERGASPSLSLIDLWRASAIVGLDLQVRTYASGGPLRDEASRQLLDRLRARLGPGATWRTEVPMPRVGDQRAWDALIAIDRVRIGVEAETRARDAQELQRRLALKQRDAGVDHVILLLRDSRHNRAFIDAAGEAFRAAFPVSGRTALQRLAVPADPGGSAIVLL
jgi:transcriptional regulator with XRE-family HTH domain